MGAAWISSICIASLVQFPICEATVHIGEPRARLGRIQQFWFSEPDTEPNWLVCEVWQDTLCRYVLAFRLGLIQQFWFAVSLSLSLIHLFILDILQEFSRNSQVFIEYLCGYHLVLIKAVLLHLLIPSSSIVFFAHTQSSPSAY